MRIRTPVAATLALSVVLLASAFPAMAQPRSGLAPMQHHITIPYSARIKPAQLARMIRSGHAPTILQVGFTTLYEVAHIKGSSHAGPAVTKKGRAALRKAAAHLDRHKLLVIYCGCCPWPKCPNIRPAFEELRKMGFTDVKAVYIPHNFGADWIRHGYPTVKGA